MHHVIEDKLEDLLTGTGDRESLARMEAHMRDCAECRQEVEAMREMSGMFSALRSPDAPQPAPGFYARVTTLIEKQQPAPFWAVALEPLFGKRLALASLLALAALGTIVVSREMQEFAFGPTPEMILAAENDSAPLLDQDQMLYTLVSHR